MARGETARRDMSPVPMRIVILLLLVAAFCLGVARSAAAASPLTWGAPVLSDHEGLQGISCPSSSLCVAVDGDGNVVTSVDPLDPHARWTVAKVDRNAIESVSCPTTSLCVAGDASGDVVTSTNPTGGKRAWTVRHVDRGNSLISISCPASFLCVAADSSGNVLSSSDPAETASWYPRRLGIGALSGVSCASTSICVAVSDGAQVATSSDPARAKWRVTGGVHAALAADAYSMRPPPILTATAARVHGRRAVDQLPGYRLHVSRVRRHELKQATVQLLFRYSDSGPGGWTDQCTGVKVKTGASTSGVLTAAHCFDAFTGSYNGAFTNSAAPRDHAENFIGAVDGAVDEYAVSDPQVRRARGVYPVADVDGLSVDTARVDVALLHMVPPASRERPRRARRSRTYKRIPALALAAAVHEPPTLGEQVGLYSLPFASGAKPVAEIGRYVGRATFPYTERGEHISRKLDFVAINPARRKVDACQFGASGSLAMFANGTLSGPLSFRFSNGYGPKHVFDPEDSSPSRERADIRYIESELGVNLARFSTICAYSALPEGIGRTLTGGFADPAVTNRIGGQTSLSGISCPSVALCVAVGGNAVVTSSSPSGGLEAVSKRGWLLRSEPLA